MELNVHFLSPGLADGLYRLYAPNCAVALLSWANSEGLLEDWTAFAYIPIDACGRGGFHFRGGRAILPVGRQLDWLDQHLSNISGHTHLSMNHPAGCVEWDEKHGNLYVNDGSVRPTDLRLGEPIQPKEWKEGTRLDITVCDDSVEMVTRSIKDGKKHARGYYHILTEHRKLVYNLS